MTKSLHIAINGTSLIKNQRTGVENFSVNLINALSKNDKNNFYTLVLPSDPKYFIHAKNINTIVVKSKLFWHKLALPKALEKIKPDIFLEPGYMLPKTGNFKSVIVIHDLACKYFPEAYTLKQKALMAATYKSAESADGVVFLSKNTEKDFLEFYKKPKNSRVINQSYDENLFNAKNIRVISNQTSKLGDYLLTVGRLETRKNIVNLIKAYELLLKRLDRDIKLVIVGKAGVGFNRIEHIIRLLPKRVSDNIIISGYIPDKKLFDLYNSAHLFIYPTFYEGFGIPILEAFASRTPVACSNCSSLPEVAGLGAIYFDPYNPNDIAQTIFKVLSDKKLCESLINEGDKQLSKFSWKKTADKFIDFFNDL